MCTACVAQGAIYVGGAAVSLRVMAHRATRRRALGLLPPLPMGADSSTDAPDRSDETELSTGTPHL